MYGNYVRYRDPMLTMVSSTLLSLHNNNKVNTISVRSNFGVIILIIISIEIRIVITGRKIDNYSRTYLHNNIIWVIIITHTM